jgi:hypothetical protein
VLWDCGMQCALLRRGIGTLIKVFRGVGNRDNLCGFSGVCGFLCLTKRWLVLEGSSEW